MTSTNSSNFLKNTKWISWSDLASRWGIRDFELIEKLSDRLQPYSEIGTELNCPSPFHRFSVLSKQKSYLFFWLKRSKGKRNIDDTEGAVLPQVQEGRDRVLSSKERLNQRREIEEQERKILAEMRAIEEADPGFSSWKYFVPPQEQANLEEIRQEFRGSLFKLADILNFEQEEGTIPLFQSAATTKDKKLRPFQEAKQKVIQKAEEYWAKDPSITRKKMYAMPEFAEILRRTIKGDDNCRFNISTFRRWLKGAKGPKPKSGRPKSKK